MASSGRPGTARSRSGRAASARGAVPKVSSRLAASAPASSAGPAARRAAAPADRGRRPRGARRAGSGCRSRRRFAAGGFPDRHGGCRHAGERHVVGGRVRACRADSCGSLRDGGALFGADAAGLDQAAVLLAVEDAVDIQQRGQLEADQADRRVVALRHPLRDRLPAGRVQRERDAGRVARAGIDDVERRPVAVVAGGEIGTRSSSGPPHLSRPGCRRQHRRRRRLRPSRAGCVRSRRTEPRWALKNGSFEVAASTELPLTAIPVMAGSVIGSRPSSQQRKAPNMGDRLSPRRGSIGCIGGGAGFVSGMNGLRVFGIRRRPAPGAGRGAKRRLETGQTTAGPVRLRAASSSSGPNSTMCPALRAASA